VDIVVSGKELPTGKLAKCEHGPDTQIQFCSKVTTTKARRPDTTSTRTHARCIVHAQSFRLFYSGMSDCKSRCCKSGNACTFETIYFQLLLGTPLIKVLIETPFVV